MAYTTIADVLESSVFKENVIQKTVEKNAFLNSGIVKKDDRVSIPDGGLIVTMPFYGTLTGDVEVLKSNTAMKVQSISMKKDVAAVHARGIAFGSEDLARLKAGATSVDPMGAIAAQLADVWSADFTKVIKSTLSGIFGVAELADSYSNQSASVLDADMMADSVYLLGDNYASLTGIACAAPVLAKLKKLDLVEDFAPSGMTPGYSTYMGKRIIVDDTLAPDATSGAYPIYLFGQGALSYSESPLLFRTEPERDALAGVDMIISRRAFVMHPRGVKWKGTPAEGLTPSDAELATAANWELVEHRKNVLIARLDAKVK